MTDRELLELAAKAAGVVGHFSNDAPDAPIFFENVNTPGMWGVWNPLTDDGDALRLAVKLRLDFYTSDMNGLSERTEENAVVCHSYNLSVPVSALVSISEPFGDDPCAATRRAIVRAAGMS